MAFTFPWENPFSCLFPDRCISFNIRRPVNTISNLHRKVVALVSGGARRTIIPGVNTKKDKELIKHLKSVQNWRKIKDHSFGLNKDVYSMLWKFRLLEPHEAGKLRSIGPLQQRHAKEVRKAVKNHTESLRTKLGPGNVFLVPDREMTFNTPGRAFMPYARPVLVYSVYPGQVLLIPFSTKISWLNPEADILFDKGHRGPALEEDGRPAVENYPYKMFSKPGVLYVSAIQPFTIEDFLAGALTHIGAVRKELLGLIGKRLKNIYPNP